jgi:hypothetical protein
MVFLWREDADDNKGVAWKLEELRPHLSLTVKLVLATIISR